ncbi:NAD-dependent epimerase/dehydratase family protein [SAR202 cluster bacterium AC-647-N09_OGT_505m]|nr:NAD-dependent epimerase/dehydratase family protein [SAR202 cluster bacterium AC-647-N09_OGT_505m]
MTPTKVLVTGGAGFIGSHVVNQLLDLGHQVVVVDNLRSGHPSHLPPDIPLYQTDITTPALEDVFREERPDLVCHYAAQISVQLSMSDPLVDADINVRGSLNLLQNCVRYGVKKVVYTSSGGAIYGEPLHLPCEETHPIHPLSPYGVSKHAVENYLNVYRQSYGLDYTVLRLSNVYGPKQDPFGEAGVVAIFSQAMLQRKPLIINGSGEQERDFLYVQDVARASIMALAMGSGEAFNIGTGMGTSVNQIHSLLKKIADYPCEASHGPSKPGEVFKIYLDITKARQKLGWEPRFSLEDGLEDTLEWFRGATWV